MRFKGEKAKRMSKIVTVLVEVVIFTALIGIIINQIVAAQSNANLSATMVVVLGLVGLFIVLGFVFSIMKTMGISTGR